MARFRLIRQVDRYLFVSGIWTAFSVLPFTVVLFALEIARPGELIFLSRSELREPFLIISVISWPFIVIGALICTVLAISSRHTPTRHHSRITLFCAAVAFLSLAAGCAATIAVAIIAFLGFKDKWSARDPNSFLRWLLPILMGIIPAIFFLYALLANFISFISAIYALLTKGSKQRIRYRGERMEEGDVGAVGVVQDVPYGPGEHDEGISRTTFEEKLTQLHVLGYGDRPKAMQALQMCDYSVERAARLLQNQREE